MLQDFKSVFDHVGTLSIKGLKRKKTHGQRLTALADTANVILARLTLFENYK